MGVLVEAGPEEASDGGVAGESGHTEDQFGIGFGEGVDEGGWGGQHTGDKEVGGLFLDVANESGGHTGGDHSGPESV